MAKSIGFAQLTNGGLYEIFDDGTQVLREAGYRERIENMVKTLNSTTNSITTTPATPAVATASASSSAATSAVKVATPDIILFDDETVPIEIMTDLIFENIGGQELINIARGDIINGQKITYQPIKNISDIERQYNPNNIVGLQNTSDTYFANFPIQIKDKIPNAGSGPNGEYVYFNSINNDLTIDVVNMQNDEQVEIQIGTDGTIYEAEL
jgi:hypothetical protein